MHNHAMDLDWFDLNDWVLINRPDVYAATQYLSDMQNQMACWRAVYANQCAEATNA